MMNRRKAWSAGCVLCIVAVLGLASTSAAAGDSAVRPLAPDPAVRLPGPDPDVLLPPPDPSVQLPAPDPDVLLPPPDPSVQLPAPDPSTQSTTPTPGPSAQSTTPTPDPSAQSTTPTPALESPAPDLAPQSNSVTSDSAINNGTGRCRTNPTAEIAEGGVWDGGGRCYIVREGITITSPVVVENATFYDPQSRAHPGDPVQPIIRVKDTAGVQLSSLALVGTNEVGDYHAEMVGEAGIDILSSDNVTLTDVSTTNTYGDGMTLGFQPGHAPSQGLTVNGLTVSNAGREGVTMGYVDGASMSDVTILGSAHNSWDFESDLPGVGSGNVVVTNALVDKGVRFIEDLSGPVTFDAPDISGDVSLINDAALSGQPVSFVGGTILLKHAFHGIPPAGIWVSGPGNLEFTDVVIGRQPSVDAITGPAWLAVGGAHLTFDGGSLPPPLGANDPSSTVQVTN